MDHTAFLIDTHRDYAQVIEERDGNQALRAIYSFGDDLLSQTRAGQLQIYHYDGLGSTRLLTDASGNITDRYDYDAFGDLLHQTGLPDNHYRYTGEQYDDSLGQYYLRARQYAPNTGRFTRMDDWMGESFEPVTLNKYLYGNADPVSYTDPTGRYSLSGVLSAINARAVQGTLTHGAGRAAINRLLVGGTTRTSASGATTAASSNGSLGLIGNLIMGEMREAVIDTLLDYAISGDDPFSKKTVFGTHAHTQLEKRINKLNDKLATITGGKLGRLGKLIKRSGIEIKAEAYFDKSTGNYGKKCRRCKNSFGIDVTILKRGKVLRAYDLKTGRGWSGREASSRAGKMNANLLQIYVIPRK